MLTDEQWGDIAEFPLWASDVWYCWFDMQWLVKILSAKHELTLLDETSCLDSGLL